MAAGGVDYRYNDEDSEFACNPCQKKNLFRISAMVCIECNENLCEKCVESHNSFSKLSGHTMEALSICETHRGKKLDRFCKKDGVIGCAMCMELDHGNCCRYVYCLTDSKQRDDQSQIAKEIIDKIENAIEGMEKNTKQLERHRNEIDYCKANCTDKINQLMNRLSELETENDKNHKKILHKITDDIEKGKEITDELKRNKHNIGLTKNYEAVQTMIIDHSKDTLSRVQKFNTNRVQLSSKDFSLIPNNEVDNLFEAIDSMRALHNETSASDDADLQTEYHVKLPTDKENCDIRSMCITNSGDIFLADYNNKTLKQIKNHDQTLMSSAEFSGRPLQICSVKDQEILVCLEEKTFTGSRHKLQFVSTQHPFKATRDAVKIDHPCGSIAVANDKIFISDTKEMVYVYPQMGRSLRQKIFRDTSGHKLFNQSRDIVVTEDESKLFIINGNKGLMILHTNGQMIHRSELQVSHIQATCLGSQGNIYLANDDRSIKKVQLSTDNNISLKERGNCDLERIQAMCYDTRRKLLITATGDSNSISKQSVL